MEVDGVKCSWMYDNTDFEKKIKRQYCARYVYYLSEITTRTRNFKKYRTRTYSENFKAIPRSVHNPLPTMWKASNTVDSPCVNFDIHVLVESHLLCTTLGLQLSFYGPLYYKSRAHCL